MKQWLKKLKHFLKLSSREEVANKEETSEKSNFYIADSPIADPALDRFKRFPFAQRIAQTIASRRDASSIVIGIYGAWGEGKTTTLRFVEKELRKHPKVICVWFNPWRFRDESHLLLVFFRTLADALGRSITSQKEKIGEWLEKYATILTPLSFPIPLLNIPLQLSPGKIRETGKVISSVELEELKTRIEKVLEVEKKRVVVLMDDIDRLDKTEIQAVFKLIKLSADFAHTAYILAFDEEMVASALGEKYGPDNLNAGRSFLEKIVQVPLRLPKADTISLRKLCFECIDEALKGAEIELTEEQTQSFVRYFVDGLEIRLQTPRIGKRYGNALAFSLPILKGEVNSVDLMLVEGLRVFYPKLYYVIRDNPDVFLGAAYSYAHTISEKAKIRSLKIIDEALEGLSDDEKEAAKGLLKVLFPRLRVILENVHYGSEWEEEWDREQRIASKQYFNRFFSYAVPEGDVSDLELESFLEKVESDSLDNIASEAKKLIGSRGADTFLLKLRRRERKFSPNISRNLALAISKIGDSLPAPEIMFSFTTPFSQAGILVSRLMQNIPKEKDRFGTAESIIQKGEPISFASECFRWMRTPKDREGQDKTFSLEKESKLGKIMAERIRNSVQKEPIYIKSPKDTPHFLCIWSQWGPEKEVSQYIAETLKKDPHNVLKLLKCYVPTSWGIESRLSSKSDFQREEYNSLTRVVDAKLIYNILSQIYGSDLVSSEYPRDYDRSFEERLARQYAYIHNYVKAEAKKLQKEKKSNSS